MIIIKSNRKPIMLLENGSDLTALVGDTRAKADES